MAFGLVREGKPAAPSRPVRALSGWDLTGLVVNGIIGSGIFGLPAIILALLGAASPLAYLLAAGAIAVVVACFAEVSTLFSEAGGPYLYAREAFGAFAGMQVGWIAWLVRITGAGANANLFVLYLGELWKPARTPLGRWLVITLLIGMLAVINFRGIQHGALVSDVFAAAKLLPLLVFALAGVFFLHPQNFRLPAAEHWDGWGQSILLLVFAYGGFENAVFPSGEALRPKRDTAVALWAGLGIVTLLYVLIQVVVVGTLPPGAGTGRPLAAAARQFLGAPGAWLISVGALISVYGWFAGSLLSVPRLTFAMGEQSALPAAFASVHRRFRTPHFSIAAFAALAWIMAVSGSFQWNATLAAVGRLVIYGTTCGSLLVFRKRARMLHGSLKPGIGVAGLAGVAFCLVLLFQMRLAEFVILALTMCLGSVTWAFSHPRSKKTANVRASAK